METGQRFGFADPDRLRRLGFLAGMTTERMRFDAERTMILTRLTLATMLTKQRLMLLELDHNPEAGRSD